MSFHVAIWMDHAEAHVLDLACDQTCIRRIHAKSKPHAPGHDPLAEHAYFEDIAKLLGPAHEVLLTGPGETKIAFALHLQSHHTESSRKVVGIETLEHPSDAQLAAYARKFFLRTDRMNGTPTAG